VKHAVEHGYADGRFGILTSRGSCRKAGPIWQGGINSDKWRSQERSVDMFLQNIEPKLTDFFYLNRTTTRNSGSSPACCSSACGLTFHYT